MTAEPSLSEYSPGCLHHSRASPIRSSGSSGWGGESGASRFLAPAKRGSLEEWSQSTWDSTHTHSAPPSLHTYLHGGLRGKSRTLWDTVRPSPPLSYSINCAHITGASSFWITSNSSCFLQSYFWSVPAIFGALQRVCTFVCLPFEVLHPVCMLHGSSQQE